jgi:hypothetical protein
MASYDEWLQPWRDGYQSHQQPVRLAFESKDSQKAIQAYEEHMPNMISIRNEVAQLEIPSYWPASTFTKLKNMAFGIKDREMLKIQQDTVVKVWGETIYDYQRKYEKLMKKQR